MRSPFARGCQTRYLDAVVSSAGILIIGNEILSGRTQDVNLQHLALRLNEWGVRLREARVIPDVEHTIVDTVNQRLQILALDGTLLRIVRLALHHPWRVAIADACASTRVPGSAATVASDELTVTWKIL